ncbi:hypothetical protein FNF29_04729 [Cafeteria roenbergensis]|uniref:RING-type domain-containing protein n=1 Tax=Cafeteria roenbergensis TaxID=33653 RepID=A0A5A8CFA0_CAFRO|nr:hypothetical protein FNF29_04729 [Cafeteria roenbergensis]|eukprot:KAA0151254.1 hypothetical protein FNF29_04729 [Cafeteria roenbergensis]
MTSVADETKATVIATGRLLGGIDAYWRVCSDASRACRRDMTAPPRGIDSVLELMCEVLARAHALCCHAIVRARWATTLRADEVDEEMLLAHSTDMLEPLWTNKEWRRRLAGWAAALDDRPVETAILSSVALLCLFAALTKAMYPQDSPLADDATGYLSDPTLDFELPPPPGSSSPSSSSSFSADSASEAITGAAATAASKLHDFATSAVSGQPSSQSGDSGSGSGSGSSSAGPSWWWLLEAMGAPPADRALLALRNRLGFVTLDQSSTSSLLQSPWPRAIPVDTNPQFRSDKLNRESVSEALDAAWLARHASIAAPDFAERAADFTARASSAVFTALAGAAAVGAAAWAGIRTVRWAGASATPKLRTRALAELERAAELALAGLDRLLGQSLGEEAATAARHRAWAAGGAAAAAAAAAGPLAGLAGSSGLPGGMSLEGEPRRADVGAGVTDAAGIAGGFTPGFSALGPRGAAMAAPPSQLYRGMTSSTGDLRRSMGAFPSNTPMTSSMTSNVSSAASMMTVQGVGGRTLGGSAARRSTAHAWDVEAASLTVELNEVLEALESSASGAASLSRLIRAMQPLRVRLAAADWKTRQVAGESAAGAAGAAGAAASTGVAGTEAAVDDDWCSEAGLDADDDLSDAEAERVALFLLGLVAPGDDDGLRSAIAAGARPAPASASAAGAGEAAAQGGMGSRKDQEGSSGRVGGAGAKARAFGGARGVAGAVEPGGTGSTGHHAQQRSEAFGASGGGGGGGGRGGGGDTPLAGQLSPRTADALSAVEEVLRVSSPRDKGFQRILASMQRLELASTHGCDELCAPECVFCLEPMLPHQPLVRSSRGDCSRFHIFHRSCFSLRWAQDNGCPVCREPVFGLRPAAVDTPFLLHAPMRGGGARNGARSGGAVTDTLLSVLGLSSGQ